MDDEAHVRLVDPHPEGDGGDDHAKLVGHETLLHGGPLGRAHPGVVGGGVHPGAAQVRGELLALLARRRVDDPRRRRAADDVQDAGELVLLLLGRDDPVGQVRAVEARHHHLGRAHLQGAQDVLADAGGRRGRKGEYGRVPEVPHGAWQEQVVRPEVVAPLRDAVGLVHHEKADAGAPERQHELQGPQTLGGDVEHLHFARANPPLDLPALLGREPGVERSGARDRALQQGVDLVFHQRDQGRHYDRQALLHQRRHLVAQALAAPRRHHGEGVPALAGRPG